MPKVRLSRDILQNHSFRVGFFPLQMQQMRKRVADYAIHNAGRPPRAVIFGLSGGPDRLLLPEARVPHENAGVLRAPMRCLRLERDQPNCHQAATLHFAPLPGRKPTKACLRCRASHRVSYSLWPLHAFRAFRHNTVSFSLEMDRARVHQGKVSSTRRFASRDGFLTYNPRSAV